jgi:hypothetical protein
VVEAHAAFVERPTKTLRVVVKSDQKPREWVNK